MNFGLSPLVSSSPGILGVSAEAAHPLSFRRSRAREAAFTCESWLLPKKKKKKKSPFTPTLQWPCGDMEPDKVKSGECKHEALSDRVRGAHVAPDRLDTQSTLCGSREEKKKG